MTAAQKAANYIIEVYIPLRNKGYDIVKMFGVDGLVWDARLYSKYRHQRSFIERWVRSIDIIIDMYLKKELHNVYIPLGQRVFEVKNNTETSA